MTKAPRLTFAEWLARGRLLRQGHRACAEGRGWVGSRPASRALWIAFDRPDWMIWLATESGVDAPRVVLAAAWCAWRAGREIKSAADRVVPERAVDLARRVGLGERVFTPDLGVAYSAAVLSEPNGESARDATYAAACVAYAALHPGGQDAAEAAWRAAKVVPGAELCAGIRRVIGWPRVARALRAQGVEVVR